MPRRRAGWVEKHSHPRRKIIQPVVPQIEAKAERAVESARGEVNRRSGQLADSLQVEPGRGPAGPWGVNIKFGVETDLRAQVWEYGDDRRDGHRTLLHIRQSIERGT